MEKLKIVILYPSVKKKKHKEYLYPKAGQYFLPPFYVLSCRKILPLCTMQRDSPHFTSYPILVIIISVDYTLKSHLLQIFKILFLSPIF
jgi:hypothetical protein